MFFSFSKLEEWMKLISCLIIFFLDLKKKKIRRTTRDICNMIGFLGFDFDFMYVMFTFFLKIIINNLCIFSFISAIWWVIRATCWLPGEISTLARSIVLPDPTQPWKLVYLCWCDCVLNYMLRLNFVYIALLMLKY